MSLLRQRAHCFSADKADLVLQVSYEGSDIVRSIVNGHQGWTFEESFETPQNTAAGRRNLSRQVRLQRSKREEHKLRRSYTQNKSCRQQKYSAEVSGSSQIET